MRIGGLHARVMATMKNVTKFTVLTLSFAQLGGLSALFGQAAPTPVPLAPTPGAPRIQFFETSFNFQKVQTTDKPVHDFIFTNTGTALLEITDVRPGCGCTTAGTWDRKVEPGQTGKIPLQFNPANFSGPVSKGATVTCNDPAQGSIYLQFQATVWRPIEVQPQYVYFLPVEEELTNETKVVKIISNVEEPLTLEAPVSSTAVFKPELKTVRPGKEFELSITYSGPISNASPQGSITIKTSSTNLPNLTLTASVMPQPALVAIPQQIQLPASPFPPDYHYAETIRNNGHTPLKLSEPTVNAEGVTVEVQETEPGKTFRINLVFSANFRARPGQPMELAVKTSHPKYPVLKVPITQAAAVPAVPPPVLPVQPVPAISPRPGSPGSGLK